jgi:RNA polymerase sigma factor (sigma-70 family)
MGDAINFKGIMTVAQNEAIKLTVEKESSRLFAFIKKRVPDETDAEDILQDVFYQLIESNRMMKTIDHLSSWLFTVARNKITDLFRKRKPESFSHLGFNKADDDESDSLNIDDLLPDLSSGPESVLARKVILAELEDALNDLPEEQRAVFIWHELEDKSFKEISSMTGLSVNTLLSRKRYAILYLRERLQDLYDELTF